MTANLIIEEEQDPEAELVMSNIGLVEINQ